MKVGIIGYGNMGASIAERLKRRFKLVVFDKDLSKTQNLKGISLAEDNKTLVRDCEVIILAVKPQDFPPLLDEIRDFSQNKLFISIAAGISTDYIEKRLFEARVIRAMPNLGIKVGRSVTCICKGKSAQEKDLIFSKKLFSYLGVIKGVEESMMNGVTALSGSGPGFIFYYLENRALYPLRIKRGLKEVLSNELKNAGMSIGFSREEAKFLAEETVKSSILLLKKTKLSPQELRIRVASKGGTTEAGLKVLSKGGSFTEAVQSALKRAEELNIKN